LQDIVIDVNKKLGVDARCRSDIQGVFINYGAYFRKISSVGVRVERHLTTHGFSLNCDNDLTWFDHITACGSDIKQTSLSLETKRPVSIDEVTPLILEAAGKYLKEPLVALKDAVPALDEEIEEWMNKN
jgi:lipoyl(octanoyl) transferase